MLHAVIFRLGEDTPTAAKSLPSMALVLSNGYCSTLRMLKLKCYKSYFCVFEVKVLRNFHVTCQQSRDKT